MIRSAETNLSKVNYQALGSEAQLQYNQAKAFIQEAENALKVKNLPFAKTVAEKAATLAAQLFGR